MDCVLDQEPRAWSVLQGEPKGVACNLEEPMGMDCVLGDERAWSVSQRNQKA